MKVVASVYSTFLQRALDNLFHDICLQELPVVLAIDRAGISGPDGATHHGIYDIGFLNAMPNMVITQPRDGHVLKELMDSAFSWGRPAAIRYPNLPTDDSDIPRKPRPLGQGEILAEGEDLLVIALGHMNQTALELRELLLQHEIRAAVVDPVFVKPLDSELFFSLLTQHSKVVTIEEHSVVAGLGSIINNFIINQGFTSTQVLNLGIPETFVGHGKNSALAEQIGLTPKQICERILSHFSFPYNSANTPIEEPSPKI